MLLAGEESTMGNMLLMEKGAWTEGKHPRDRGGRFACAPGLGIAGKLKKYAVPMERVEFTRENYERLFPGGRVNTPLGVVKMGAHQYEKLEAKGRQKYLGATFQTLHDPVFIVNTEKEGKEYILFVKSFHKESEGTLFFFGVVADIEGKLISVSAYPNDSVNNTINRIKKGSTLYAKDAANVVSTRTVNSPSSMERQLTDKVSRNPLKKSRPRRRLVIRKKLAAEIMRALQKM